MECTAGECDPQSHSRCPGIMRGDAKRLFEDASTESWKDRSSGDLIHAALELPCPDFLWVINIVIAQTDLRLSIA